MAREYDVAILGGTSAGLVAALRLARAKRRVVLIDAPREPTESPLSDWAPREFFDQAPFLKRLTGQSGAEAFHTVQFYSADAARSAQFRSPRVAGYVLPAGKLLETLRAAAKRAKVERIETTAWPGLNIGEHHVGLTAGGGVQAKLLLIAQDSPTKAINELGLPMRSIPQGGLTVAGLDVAWTTARLAKHVKPGLSVVDLPTRGHLGLFFPVGPVLHLRLISREGESPDRLPAALSGMLAAMQRAALVPPELPLDSVRGAMWRPPGGVALDLETHVAKRTLLVGTAGGFADMITGQTLTPSVRSALIAVKVAEKALTARDPQGAAGAFKNEWRKGMADYLRPPSTSLHLLLPLLFVNKEMISRIARAILCGQAI